MGITCLFLRRPLVRYQDGELDAGSVKVVEEHLLDCGACRARLLQLRSGQRFARELPRISPEPDDWERLEAAIDASTAQRATAHGSRIQAGLRALMMRPAVVALALAMAVLAVVMFALYIRASRMNREAVAQRASTN